MLLSPEFLLFAHSANTYQLYRLLCSRSYRAIYTRCQHANPNYGTCWFKAKIFPLGTAEDVIVRATKFTAKEVSWHSDLYYEAMLKAARRSASVLRQEEGLHTQNAARTGREEENEERFMERFLLSPSSLDGSAGGSSREHPSFHLYTYAFQPDQMYCTHDSLSTEKKMILLFGSSQIEAWACLLGEKIAPRSFDLRTSGLWALHASPAPRCFD